VPPLRIVADFVVCPETNPVRDGPVLPCLLGQDLLGPKSLLGRHPGELKETLQKRKGMWPLPIATQLEQSEDEFVRSAVPRPPWGGLRDIARELSGRRCTIGVLLQTRHYRKSPSGCMHPT